MRDLLIEEIFGDSRRDHPRRPSRKDQTIPSASRYPHSMKRAEQERERQPWLKGRRESPPQAVTRFLFV